MVMVCDAPGMNVPLNGPGAEDNGVAAGKVDLHQAVSGQGQAYC